MCEGVCEYVCVHMCAYMFMLTESSVEWLALSLPTVFPEDKVFPKPEALCFY